MQTVVLGIHIAVGLLFIILVLMQDKGVGFGGAIGGVGGGASFYSTKRGAAKLIATTTIVLAVVFLGSALAYVVVPADAPDATSISPTVESTPVTIDSAPTITASGDEE